MTATVNGYCVFEVSLSNAFNAGNPHNVAVHPMKKTIDTSNAGEFSSAANN
jgi:hypothetical protein